MLHNNFLNTVKTKIKSCLESSCLNLQNHTHKYYIDKSNSTLSCETIKELALNLDKNSFLSFSTVSVSIDDAVLNTLAYTCDNSHTRFYSLEEILSFKPENTELYMYLSFKEQVLLKDIIEKYKDKEKDINAQMKNIPENVAKYMNVQYYNNNIKSFDITISSFILRVIC